MVPRSFSSLTRYLVLAMRTIPQAARMVLLLFLWARAIAGHAQEVGMGLSYGNSGYDSSYVRDYTHILTTRVYVSSKFNSFTIEDGQTGASLQYRPNNQVNLGIGASYRSLTLNLGFGFSFLNQDVDAKGETDYFDAQANVFRPKWAINSFFQTYRGYYIDGYTKAELGWNVPTELPARRDIRQATVGITALHIFNDQRFSYRAAFNQDAWQRKSAGSWLAGGYGTYYAFRADSSLVPSALDSLFSDELEFRAGGFLDMGVMGGYAHTFVVARNWFLTMSYAVGLGGVFSSQTIQGPEGDIISKERTGGVHGQGRFAGGYNSSRTCVALTYNIESVSYSVGAREQLQWSVGNVRLNVVHRFKVKVRPVDKVFGGG